MTAMDEITSAFVDGIEQGRAEIIGRIKKRAAMLRQLAKEAAELAHKSNGYVGSFEVLTEAAGVIECQAEALEVWCRENPAGAGDAVTS